MPDVLRVHLTAEDLLRTRFASQPAPLIEVGHALAALHRRDPGFGRWRRAAATGFPVSLRSLLELVPASATGPLSLDPVSTDLAEGLSLVQQTPASFAAEEMRRVCTARSPTPLDRRLAERDRGTWEDLVRALRLAYRYLLEQDWPQVHSGFRSEVAWRGRLLAELGLQATLATLHPLVSWNGTVLQIEAPGELDLYPGGAGLMLLPSLFWTGRPMIGEQPDGSAVIVYPAVTPLPLVGEVTDDPLGELLGRTRAALLELAVTERTTSELARELRVAAATVSGHTKTLRAAGLIVTARAGKAVLHSATPLGDKLLASTGRLPAHPGRHTAEPAAHHPGGR
jgi:DNA-binding transcriptional ArsR family regulator